MATFYHSRLVCMHNHDCITKNLFILLSLQFDTHPLGTVNLMLSDDFADEGFYSTDLPYCKGDVQCQYLDPWDLNWPRGMFTCKDIINYCTHYYANGQIYICMCCICAPCLMQRFNFAHTCVFKICYFILSLAPLNPVIP